MLESQLQVMKAKAALTSMNASMVIIFVLSIAPVMIMMVATLVNAMMDMKVMEEENVMMLMNAPEESVNAVNSQYVLIKKVHMIAIVSMAMRINPVAQEKYVKTRDSRTMVNLNTCSGPEIRDTSPSN